MAWAEAYLRTKWHLDPCSRLATIYRHHRQDRQDRQTGQTDRQRSDSIGRTVLQTVAPKRLYRSICRLGCGLGWAEGSTNSIVFARWRHCALWEGSLAPLHRANTVRPMLPSICGGDTVLSNYFDHLFILVTHHIFETSEAKHFNFMAALWNRAFSSCGFLFFFLLLYAAHSNGQAIIFCSCGFYLSILLLLLFWQSCAMVPRWRFFGSCISSEPRAAHFRPSF